MKVEPMPGARVSVLDDGKLLFERWRLNHEGADCRPMFIDEALAILEWLRQRALAELPVVIVRGDGLNDDAEALRKILHGEARGEYPAGRPFLPPWKRETDDGHG